MATAPSCMDCGNKTMKLVTDRYRAEIKHDGRAYLVDLPVLQFYRCSNCPESIVLPEAADQAIGIELRRVAKLLSPAEIKEIRKRFELSQQELADVLDIAESTVCRWETGVQIQQRHFDKMRRAYAELPEFRNYLSSHRVAKSAVA